MVGKIADRITNLQFLVNGESDVTAELSHNDIEALLWAIKIGQAVIDITNGATAELAEEKITPPNSENAPCKHIFEIVQQVAHDGDMVKCKLCHSVFSLE